MAVAIFAAVAALLPPAAKVPVVELVQPLLPEPVVTALQTKLLAVLVSVSELAGLPKVVLLTVTTLPVTVAVTPTAGYAALQALMAFARLVAEVVG